MEEIPTDLPAGQYTAVSYCADEDGNTLIYEPQLITITGDAPIDEMDLTASATGDRVTLAGTAAPPARWRPTWRRSRWTTSRRSGRSTRPLPSSTPGPP